MKNLIAANVIHLNCIIFQFYHQQLFKSNMENTSFLELRTLYWFIPLFSASSIVPFMQYFNIVEIDFLQFSGFLIYISNISIPFNYIIFYQGFVYFHIFFHSL